MLKTYFNNFSAVLWLPLIVACCLIIWDFSQRIYLPEKAANTQSVFSGTVVLARHNMLPESTQMAAWREANTPKPQPKVAEKPAKPKKLAPLMSGATSLASEALRVRATFVQLSSNNASTKPSAFAYLEIQNLENRIIRYQRVAVGDMIDGYKIESVSGDMVTMRRQPTADNPDTLLLEIAVFGKRNE